MDRLNLGLAQAKRTCEDFGHIWRCTKAFDNVEEEEEEKRGIYIRRDLRARDRHILVQSLF